jgi:DNA-3-methyladenine glycosylase II
MAVSMTTKPLTEETFHRALAILRKRDPDLEDVLLTYGPPPMWARKPGFATLVHIILEQQVSLASARAAFDRLRQVIPELTPAEFLKLDANELKRIGFSHQKSRYCRGIAGALGDGSLRLGRLEKMDDHRARGELLQVTGIGPWTADIYLLMALRRPDVWPSGDLALARAAQQLRRLDSRPSETELEALGRPWKPWRAVAARILWHHYLSCQA